MYSALETRWRTDNGLLRDVRVSTNVDRYRVGCRGGRGLCAFISAIPFLFWLLQTEEVTPNNGLRLDDCFAAEDDMLRAVDEAAPGDFVASIL